MPSRLDVEQLDDVGRLEEKRMHLQKQIDVDVFATSFMGESVAAIKGEYDASLLAVKVKGFKSMIKPLEDLEDFHKLMLKTKMLRSK